jgi:Tol biopolymer transport system component
MRAFRVAAGLWLFASACAPMQQAPLEPSLRVTGASRKLTQLTRDATPEFHPSLSPDGKTLYFSRVEVDPLGNRREEVIIGIDPNRVGGEGVYTSANSIFTHPMAGPKGEMIYAISNTAGGWAVVRSRASRGGGAVRVVVPNSIANALSYVDVAPDDSRVYFSGLINNNWKVASMGVDGTGLTVLGDGRNPRVSPDGKTLLFQRTAATSFFQIFLLDADTGGGLTQLTKIEDYAIEGAWSPDGNWIVFCTNIGWKEKNSPYGRGVRNLYAIRKDGTSLTQITDGKGTCRSPHWGKDNQIYFAYSEVPGVNFDNWDIWRLEPVLE